MTDELSKKLDVPKNLLILCSLALILGFLIIIALIICMALNAINVQGVKEFLGILGGFLVSPSVIIFFRKFFSQSDKKSEPVEETENSKQ